MDVEKTIQEFNQLKARQGSESVSEPASVTVQYGEQARAGSCWAQLGGRVRDQFWGVGLWQISLLRRLARLFLNPDLSDKNTSSGTEAIITSSLSVPYLVGGARPSFYSVVRVCRC